MLFHQGKFFIRQFSRFIQYFVRDLGFAYIVEQAPAVQKKIEKLKVEDRAKVRLQESVKERVAEGVQFRLMQ